ncbi:MAG: CAP domain-containing protein [Parcubacteria group bacterium]|jgi:hypothetical protein
MAKINKNINKILAIGLMFLFFAVFSVANSNVAQASEIKVADVVKLLNQARIANGLDALKENSILDLAAEAKAEDMVKNDYFAHTSPSGIDPWYWFKKLGYGYKYAGENLAVNYDSAEEQHKAWMNSKTHRANILNANYREVGVAVVKGKIDGENSLLTVEMFGTPTFIPADPGAAGTPMPKGQEVKASEAIPAEKVESVPLPAENLDTPNTADVAKDNSGYLKNPVSAPLPENNMRWIGLGLLLAFILTGISILAGPMILTFKVYEILALVRAEKQKKDLLEASEMGAAKA